MRWLILALILALFAGTLAWRIGAARFAARVEVLWQEIESGPAPVPQDDLPGIVRDFAERGLAGSAAGARAVRILQDNTFRQRKGGPLVPLPARQVTGTGAPGFAWLAERRQGPIVLFRVLDSYAGGKGWLAARLLGVIPVADARGAAIDRAEAMRYLAELPWAPDAILGNPDLDWRQVADDAVEVATQTAGGEARVTLHFDAAGDVVRMTAEDRPAGTGPDGEPVLRPWQAHFRDYGEIGGRRVPRSGEVGYVYEDGYEPYWIGRIIGYEVLR